MPLTLNALPLSAMIKEATEENHKETEKLLLPALTGVQSREDYAAILRMFYGYFFPLENLVQAFISTEQFPDISGRRTAGHILHDLESLGLNRTDFPLCENLPSVNSAAHAFGALYVMEGSTLGGKIIARMLQKNTAFPVPEDALHFFSGYREETGRKWKTFLEALNQQTETDEVITTANKTFFHLKSWMQRCFFE